MEEAIAASRKALALDPLAPLININVGRTYFAAGRPVEASHQAAKMIENYPDVYGAYWLQGAIHLSAGECQAAVAQLQSAVSLGGDQVAVADLASACSLAGATREATPSSSGWYTCSSITTCRPSAWRASTAGSGTLRRRSSGSRPRLPSATGRWFLAELRKECTEH